MKKILFIALGLLMAVTSFGQDSLTTDSTQMIQGDTVSIHNAEFSGSKLEDATKAEGDSAYIRNDFASAIQIYESLLRKGESAILNYEKALLLQPGNGDIRANLEIARGKTVDKVEVVPEIFFVTWTKALINSMSVDSWAIWGIVNFLLLIVSLYFFIFSKQVVLKKVGFITGIIFLIVVVMANVFASKQKEELLNRDTAIIMSPSVTVRSTPSENGTSLFILHEGHKVNIKDDSMKDWKEIRLEDGKVGWVPVGSIEII